MIEMSNDLFYGMERLGIKKLRQEQEIVLPKIMMGEDTSVILNTGGGKSLLYQIPVICEWKEKATTIVVSPLKALQRDQFNSFAEMLNQGMKPTRLTPKIRTALLNSDLSKKERSATLQAIAEKKINLLFLAPEQLKNQQTLEALSKANIKRVVVDEAHVLRSAGEGFRPNYLKIGPWLKTLSYKPQIILLSSTLSSKNLKFVQTSLGTVDSMEFRFPVERENLNAIIKKLSSKDKNKIKMMRYQFIESDLKQRCQRMQKKGEGSVIIYCVSVPQTNDLYRWLKARGFNVGLHHSDLTKKQREDSMEAFMCDKCPIMIATSGFGMGINKSNVRLVIHAHPPLTLEDYIQQIGRGGRDGKKCDCILYYSKADWSLCNFTVGKKGRMI